MRFFRANATTEITIVATAAEAYRITPVGRVAEDSGGGDSEGAGDSEGVGVDVPGELLGEGSGPPIWPDGVMKLISPVSAHSMTWIDQTRGG